jgi:hypothetical protein
MEYIKYKDETAQEMSEANWDQILGLNMPTYLKEALVIMKTLNPVFMTKDVHSQLREKFPLKYISMDYKYGGNYEKAKGLQSIKAGLNQVFKKANMPIRLRQFSLEMYARGKRDGVTFFFVVLKT